MVGMGFGILCGLASGLLPGIHTNTMAVLLAGWSFWLLPVIGPAGIAAALVSTLITHSFIEIIPAAFLGVPEDGTALSVLPAHALTLAGKGEEAIRISALGSLLGIVAGIPLSLGAYLLLPGIQGLIDWWTGLLLVLILGFFIVCSGSPGWSLGLFLVSGMLGLFAFRYEYLVWHGTGDGAVLMPLLTGMFGLPLLLLATEGVIPRQLHTVPSLHLKDITAGTISGTAAGLIVGWLPGLSNATANGVIASFIPEEDGGRRFLLATGAAASANAVMGIAALYGIGRMRSGVMAALAAVEHPSLLLILTILAASGAIAYLLAVGLSRYASCLSGVNARLLSHIVFIALVVLCGALTGPFGAGILFLSMLIGLVPELVQVSRVSCIGVVTIPVILYSFGIGGIS